MEDQIPSLFLHQYQGPSGHSHGGQYWGATKRPARYVDGYQLRVTNERPERFWFEEGAFDTHETH